MSDPNIEQTIPPDDQDGDGTVEEVIEEEYEDEIVEEDFLEQTIHSSDNVALHDSGPALGEESGEGESVEEEEFFEEEEYEEEIVEEEYVEGEEGEEVLVDDDEVVVDEEGNKSEETLESDFVTISDSQESLPINQGQPQSEASNSSPPPIQDGSTSDVASARVASEPGSSQNLVDGSQHLEGSVQNLVPGSQHLEGSSQNISGGSQNLTGSSQNLNGSTISGSSNIGTDGAEVISVGPALPPKSEASMQVEDIFDEYQPSDSAPDSGASAAQNTQQSGGTPQQEEEIVVESMHEDPSVAGTAPSVSGAFSVAGTPSVSGAFSASGVPSVAGTTPSVAGTPSVSGVPAGVAGKDPSIPSNINPSSHHASLAASSHHVSLGGESQPHGGSTLPTGDLENQRVVAPVAPLPPTDGEYPSGEEKQSSSSTYWACCLILLVIFLGAGIVGGWWLARLQNDGEDAPPLPARAVPTSSPTFSPTTRFATPFAPILGNCDFMGVQNPNVIDQCACVGEIQIIPDDVRGRYQFHLDNFISQNYRQGFDEGISSCTARNQALVWLSSANDADFGDEERLTRYALAAIFAGTDGSGWKERQGWLSEGDHCQWFGISCNAGEVRSISLENNNLSGAVRTSQPRKGLLTFFGLEKIQSIFRKKFFKNNICLLSFFSSFLFPFFSSPSKLPHLNSCNVWRRHGTF